MKGLNSVQLSEWQTIDRLDPIGEWRNDFRFASLEAMILNIVKMLYPKKGSIVKLVNAMDLMYQWGKEKKPEPKKQNYDQMKEMFNEISKVSGNPIKTKKNEHR